MKKPKKNQSADPLLMRTANVFISKTEMTLFKIALLKQGYEGGQTEFFLEKIRGAIRLQRKLDRIAQGLSPEEPEVASEPKLTVPTTDEERQQLQAAAYQQPTI